MSKKKSRLSKEDKRLVKKTICRAFAKRHDCLTERGVRDLCESISAVCRYDNATHSEYGEAGLRPIGVAASGSTRTGCTHQA